MMADLIDRAAAKRLLVSDYAYAAADEIDKLPAVDAVEVCRCKDCKHAREMDKYEKKLYMDECVVCTKLSTSYHSVIVMPDDFCSHGERGADDEQS